MRRNAYKKHGKQDTKSTIRDGNHVEVFTKVFLSSRLRDNLCRLDYLKLLIDLKLS